MSSIIAAFSGGKDSTALVIHEAERGRDFELLFTPAGNEPEELMAHVENIANLIKRPLHVVSNHNLDFWIKEFNALPNWRQRWCTRLLKIEPAKAFLAARPGSTLLVGLRADEEERQGLYGDFCQYEYPLRDLGWGESDVWKYLDSKGVTIPVRRGGNCKLCFYQGLAEWFYLWRDDPESYAEGEAYEAQTGFTFRSPGRDTWPAGLVQLRGRFERGEMPRGATNQMDLFDEEHSACRVCTL